MNINNGSHSGMHKFEIFKAGQHVSSDGRKVNVTLDDLHEIAQSYDPDFAGAPLVIGHPDIDAPAYGWVKSLFVDADTLIAEVENVEPQFAEMVNDRRFPNRSAGLYFANTLGNPMPGKKYLQHVGFLGAAAPSIKGLKPVQFAEGQAIYFNNPLITNTQEFSMPLDDKDDITREKELAAREAAVSQAETKMAAHEAKLKREAALHFAENLATEGKLLPNEIPAVTELLFVLPEMEPLHFSESGSQITKSPDAVLRDLLSALPNRIDYSEKSASTEMVTPLQFSAPQGIQVDQAQSDLYRKATEYQNSHPGIDWVAAVQAVGG